MNRLKLWVFALLVMGLAALASWRLATDQRRQALEALDRQLVGAQARAEAAQRSLEAELVATAGLAAQDEKLLSALRPSAAPEPEAVAPGKPRRPVPPPPPAPSAEQQDPAVDQAAAQAVAGAQGLLGSTQAGRQVRAASREGLSRRPPAEADAAAFLQEALDGKARRGLALLDGKLFAGAAVPVAGGRGALAVFQPLDDAWARAAVAGTDVALLVVGPGHKPVASARQAEAEALARAAAAGTGPVGAGSLGKVEVSPAWLGLQVPPVPSLLGPLPADEVLARPLPGPKGERMVLAVSGRDALLPAVRLEWTALAALALVLLLTLIFSLLIRPSETVASVPAPLLEAAKKVEKGDFSVRAPVLAGKLGTLAAALNKAAEAAQSVPQAPAVASLASEFFNKAPEPMAPDPGEGFALPPRAPREAPVGEPLGLNETARLDGADLAAAPPTVPASAAHPEPLPPLPPAPSAAPVAAPAPAVAAAAAARAEPAVAPPRPTAPAVDGDEEEGHWREIFRDFVRTRGECGESAEGLTYERFRNKLESNKGSLMAKYGCKTVRFQVYVKDGKAALKATPVR